MDVLVTHSNHIYYDEKQCEKMTPYPPLQTLIAAAALRRAGARVAFVDVTLRRPEDSLQAAIQSLAPSFVLVCEDDFNFVTKMCLRRNRELSFWIAQLARRHHCTVAVHSSDASDHIAGYLDAGFDYVLTGEIEETLAELVAARPVREIRGLAYREAGTGRLHVNPPRPVCTDLDALPAAAWDLVDVEEYRQAWTGKHGYFSLNLVSSRGCPYRCNWCAKPIYGNNYHVRSPKAVAAEMLFLKQHFRPGHIWFADDIFGLSASWVRDFADAVESLGAGIPFKMQSRCDLMTAGRVRDLKRAGCSEIWMGAESGSQKILDAMEKGIQVADIYSARACLRQHRIRAGWFLQFGYPGEDWEEITQTIDMVRATRPDDVGISVSYPLPRTRFYQLVSSQIDREANWTQSGDLSILFRGTFSSDLYKAVARAIHLEVREPQRTQEIAEAWSTVTELRSSAMAAAGGV